LGAFFCFLVVHECIVFPSHLVGVEFCVLEFSLNDVLDECDDCGKVFGAKGSACIGVLVCDALVRVGARE